MTTPFDSVSYPSSPTAPTAAPAGYVTPQQPDAARREPPFDAAAAEAMRGQFIDLILQQILKAIFGFFSAGGGSPFDQLTSWIASIPGGAVFQQLLDSLFNTATGQQDVGVFIGDVVAALPNLLSAFSALNPLNLFGLLQPWQIALVPDSSQGPTRNLLVAQNFATIATVVAGMGWSWDSIVGHNGVGAAKFVGSGVLGELLANQIPMLDGQTVNISTWVKWSSITYTGTNPIAVGVTLFRAGIEVDNIDIAFLASPAASGGWSQLSGAFTVPPDNIDEVRLRLKVDSNLTSGTVWFDDAEASKPDVGGIVPGIGSLLDMAVTGLQNLEGSFFSLFDVFGAFHTRMAASVDHSTRISSLETVNIVGNTALDQFERVDNDDLGIDWQITYYGAGAGSWAIPNGHDCSWQENGSTDRGFIARFLGNGTEDATSAIDDQKVQAVLGSAAGNPDFAANPRGWNSLLGRMSTDNLNYIEAWFSGDGQVAIDRVLAGVRTTLASTTIGAPGAGANLGLVCGPGRNFAATINGSNVLTASDSTSGMGASYRGWGHGGFAEGYTYVFFYVPHYHQAFPGSLNSWAGQDLV